jgi:hypothetical protein
MTLNQDYKRTFTRFSAYSINSPDEFEFSAEAYSKFKYGAENIAQQFGYDLAERFIKNYFAENYDGQQIIVLSSAYSYIPTASFYMKNFFVERLNDYLFRHHHPVVDEVKIYRTMSYREDYGAMSADERHQLIKNDKFYFDRTYIGNKSLIFLDDVRITGTHERIIVKMLDDYGINNRCYMLFFAELIDDRISPKVENTLNNAFVKNLDNIESIISDERFRFNTRVVKFILNSPHDKFDDFITRRDRDFIHSLYYNAIGNEYYQFTSYFRNLMELSRMMTGEL